MLREYMNYEMYMGAIRVDWDVRVRCWFLGALGHL